MTKQPTSNPSCKACDHPRGGYIHTPGCPKRPERTPAQLIRRWHLLVGSFHDLRQLTEAQLQQWAQQPKPKMVCEFCKTIVAEPMEICSQCRDYKGLTPYIAGWTAPAGPVNHCRLTGKPRALCGSRSKAGYDPAREMCPECQQRAKALDDLLLQEQLTRLDCLQAALSDDLCSIKARHLTLRGQWPQGESPTQRQLTLMYNARLLANVLLDALEDYDDEMHVDSLPATECGPTFHAPPALQAKMAARARRKLDAIAEGLRRQQTGGPEHAPDDDRGLDEED